MDDALVERVEALERAVTDGEYDLSGLAADAESLERLQRLEERLDDVEDCVAELEAATQALRGYVGNVRAVNEEVERRADAALETAETLEMELSMDGDDLSGDPTGWGSAGTRQTDAEIGADESPTAPSGAGIRSPSPNADAPHDSQGRETVTSDGGLTAQPTGGARGREETTGQGNDHCEVCGRARTPERPTAGASSDGRAARADQPIHRPAGTESPAAGTATPGMATPKTATSGTDDARTADERDDTGTADDRDDPFEWLGESDPLVPEDDEVGDGDEGGDDGRLGRFRDLL